MTLILMTLIPNSKYSYPNISGICKPDNYDVIFQYLPVCVNFIKFPFFLVSSS